MTIFRGRQKLQQQEEEEEGEEEQNEEEEEEEQQQQQHEEEEEEAEEKHAQNFDKKMCGRMLTSCGLRRTSHCALHQQGT